MSKASRIIGLASVVAASLGLVAPSAAPAAAREYELVGQATVKDGCNNDTLVRFTVVFKNGDFKKVHDFETLDLNFPNYVQPPNQIFPPIGIPSGDCVPGTSEDWESYDWDPDPEKESFDLPFGRGAFKKNEFSGLYTPKSSGGTIFEAYEVYGKVKVKKGSGKSNFKVNAKGYFIRAGAEAGLDVGGRSSGNVTWKAHN